MTVKKLNSQTLKKSVMELLAVLRNNPFQNPPSYEKLPGDLSCKYSRRKNILHRLVYEVLEEQNIVRILRM